MNKMALRDIAKINQLTAQNKEKYSKNNVLQQVQEKVKDIYCHILEASSLDDLLKNIQGHFQEN